MVAPIFFFGVYGFSWYMADEGKVKKLVESVEINTDPNKNPTPTQLFHHIWPYVAGSLGTLFDSVACKFSQTSDFKWLCKDALNDDTNATVALQLLTPPAENAPPFARAICEQPGTLRRLKEIIAIYKTMPREQHDDVMLNACILMAKVATMPDLRSSGVGLGEFVWMMPQDKAHLYTQYGIDGIAALWKADTRSLLASGAVLRLAELLAATSPYLPLRPVKLESSPINQLLAHRLLGRIAADRDTLIAEGAALEAQLVKEMRAIPAVRQKTIWQKAGVHRGETELEINARVRAAELQSVGESMAYLRAWQPVAALGYIEQLQSALCIGTAGLLGALYGGARGWVRAWWADVTPSVCYKVATHVSGRSAAGAMLLVGFFEAAPQLKKHALEAMSMAEVADYAHSDALRQLVGVDLAYLAVITFINFAFPYVLLPVAFNPAQLLVMPSEPPPNKSASDAKA